MTADVTAWRNGVRMVGAVRWSLSRWRLSDTFGGVQLLMLDINRNPLSERVHASRAYYMSDARARLWADGHIRTWLMKKKRTLDRRIARIEADIVKAERRRRK